MPNDTSFRLIDESEQATSAMSPTGVRLLRATGPLPDISIFGAPSTRRARILVVDDEEPVRKMLLTILESTYECSTASNAEEAIELMATNPFDVAIVDIVMPRFSGASLLKQIRAEMPSTIVILMTGLQDARLGVESIRMGAFDFISKPFRVDEIRLSIQRALRFKEIIDEAEFYQVRLESLVVERTSALQGANEQLEGSLLETTLSFRAILHELTAALEARDIEVCGHTERVVAYAMRLGKQMGLGHAELVTLEHGALLHDVGTIFLSEEILRKPTQLNEQEWTLMRQHPEYGGRMLRRCGMLADAAPIVEQHHERWDGNGYPLGLKGQAIDIRARIFAVADCLDVMLSDRPYSPATSLGDAAAELLECKGQQFDPTVVDAFFDVGIEEWRQVRSFPFAQSVPVTGQLNVNALKSDTEQ